ncbi:glutamate--tRNA ligase [Algicella marina]|uniref:Glutamate--tRNA ligase n=1 Tax=Algicella marina TaxID=2683284 RepID=A0A6P1SVL3_9RHOB|nr:glutamate--tRNA ligase [Algicella marina]QHQ34724.1 glutamate--tRNA ligase [Algicella marina]
MSATPVVTRFAPSPTGYLHIGGARTALFNWLFARHHQGKFLLRIEDTDKARSTPEATEAIYAGLRWLGLDWDDEPVSQAERAPRHTEVAHQMLANGTAYKCYATKEEIDTYREAAKAAGRPPLFRSPWRNSVEETDLPYVVRLKAPQTGETAVEDAVQGSVTWKNETLDDLILLRSDGSPTYMLAVVVDDHDMGVTHVIRGDDHLTNAARQSLIYKANGWDLPVFAHIPLIHGPDGAKLSKRHGALGVEAYRDMGYPAAAMRNYLARLGWSHGDDEFFTTEQAIDWFTLDTIGKSPARFDFKKLESISGQHIRSMEAEEILSELSKFVAAQNGPGFTTSQVMALRAAAPGLRDRAKTIPELLEMAHFILGSRPFEPDEKAARQLDTVSRGMLKQLTSRLQNVDWTAENIQEAVKHFADEEELKLGKVAQPMRAALTGRTISPSVFDMMEILGQEESLARLEDAATGEAVPH